MALTVVALAAALVAAAGGWALARRRARELAFLRRGLSTLAGSDLRDGDALRAVAAAREASAHEKAEGERMQRLLIGAMERARDLVHVARSDGREILRSSPGSPTGSASGDAIFEHTVRELLVAAAKGAFEDREISVSGPPPRYFGIRAAPIERGGARVGAVVIAQDMTEARRVERVRRDFVANISHELRTPIGALAVLAEAASMETDEASLRRLCERMEDEAHRLGSMVDDVASLSRLEADEPHRAELVDIDELVVDAAERAEASARQRGLSVVVDAVDRGLRVRGDRLQLLSAIHNLLENALKYSDKGDAVRVRVTRTRTHAGGQEFVEIAVVDRGIGIPARDRERIFERFYRVDRARARDTGGTGLGLAIVRHVAVNHNGEVLVESVEGEGSTFTLRLLAAPDAAEGAW